jgi:DNA-binding GntR family transcriptional regulator
MPSQRELAERYGVAPETLRKALDVLVREGVVSAGSTRGTFVLKVPGEPEPSPEYQQLAAELHRLADRIDALEAQMDKALAERHGTPA